MTLRILIALLILGCAGYWYWTTTPEYSMERVKHAVKDHDLITFQKYVDTDSVAAGIVDDLLAAPMRRLLGPGLIGRCIVAGVVGVFKQPMVDGIKDDINHFVLSGQLLAPGNSVDTELQPDLTQPNLTLGVLDSRLGFRKHAFKKVEYDVKDGDVCKLGLLFHNQVYDKDLVLEVQMRKSGGYWRLIQLTNFPEFTGKLMEMQTGARHDAEQQNAGAGTSG
jgi:hypothetical protein